MKYYLYISDTKLEMLYPQIPHNETRKTSLEFGFDLKFVKASRKTEKETDANRFTKLDAIVDYLEASGRLGTLDEQKEYVRAAMPMKFAPWGAKGRETHVGTNDVSPQHAVFACFAGRTDKYQSVLWGSWKHVLGENIEGADGRFSPSSSSLATLAMWDYLNRLERDEEWSRTDDEDELTYLTKLRNRADLWRGMNVNAFQIYAKTEEALKIPCVLATLLRFELNGPEQGMEFVAKKMQYGALGDGLCFLGTPLYVAMT